MLKVFSLKNQKKDTSEATSGSNEASKQQNQQKNSSAAYLRITKGDLSTYL